MNVAAATIPSCVAPLRAQWRPLTDMEPLRADWTALAARALEPNVFYEPAFVRAAASVFGGKVGAGLVWSEDGTLVGLFPARVERRYGLPLRVLTGWTHPFGPLGTPLVDQNAAEAVIATWLDHLASNTRLPGLMLWPLLAEGPIARALHTVLSRRGDAVAAFGQHQRALLAPAGRNNTNYLDQAIGAGKRKELRRQRRRLADLGAVKIEAAAEVSTIGEALGEFLPLEAQGWKGRAGTAAANHDGLRRFLMDAVTGLAGEGKARVDGLRLGDRTIATLVTLRSGDTAWAWKIAYDEDFARFSPGVQLMLEVTESLLSDTDIVRADSCADPDHPMIDHLWRERLTLADHLVAVRPQPVGFRMICGLEALRRSAIAGAKAVRDRLRA
jgi:CelD/BcsL family acetyltransferase involved in cellulose biosynthesis